MQEKAARLEAEQSLDALLQSVKEMEGVVEREKEQVRGTSWKIPVRPSVCHHRFLFMSLKAIIFR